MRRGRRLRGESGQATVEFALVLPLLLVVLVAIVELGLVIHNYMNLVDAVRTGGRVAALSRTAPNPQIAAQTAVANAADGLRPNDLAVTVTSTWQPGADVTVRATYPYTISIIGIPVRTGSLTSSTTQRVE